jgi:type IV pilus assembly protein PilC
MVVIGCIRPVKRLGEAERVQRLILEAPVIGPILSGICLVRALNALALLKACGAPTDLQFTLAAQAAGTAVHRRYFSSLHRRVVAGEELQDAAQREGHLLPGEGGRLVAARLRIGSFSGDSATLLRRLADELLERADHRASLLPQILEIPLLLVCGAVIAGLVLAMLLPMPGLVIDLMRRPGGF